MAAITADEETVAGLFETPKRMKPEVKAKWLEDLRSGEYEQGRWTLKHQINNTYCCLGVLAEGQRCLTRPGSAWLDESQLQLTGLSEGVQGFLSHMNDAGHSFAEIADWIEENL